MDYEKIGRRTVELLEAVASFVERWREDRSFERIAGTLTRARVLVVDLAAELSPELRDRVARALPVEPTEAEALSRVLRFDA